MDFLEGWIASNVTSESKDPADAGPLAAKLLAEAAVVGFTRADMDLDEDTLSAETHCPLSFAGLRMVIDEVKGCKARGDFQDVAKKFGFMAFHQ